MKTTKLMVPTSTTFFSVRLCGKWVCIYFVKVSGSFWGYLLKYEGKEELLTGNFDEDLENQFKINGIPISLTVLAPHDYVYEIEIKEGMSEYGRGEKFSSK